MALSHDLARRRPGRSGRPDQNQNKLDLILEQQDYFFDVLIQILTNQEFIMSVVTDTKAAVESVLTDVSALVDKVTALLTFIGVRNPLTPEDTAALAALQADAAALDTRVKTASGSVDAEAAALTPPPPAPVLTVSPNTVSAAAGVASTQALSLSGGTAPFAASGLPAGVTFDGSNLVFDTTTQAGTASVSISDASTPPLTAAVSVVIA